MTPKKGSPLPLLQEKDRWERRSSAGNKEDNEEQIEGIIKPSSLKCILKVQRLHTPVKKNFEISMNNRITKQHMKLTPNPSKLILVNIH